MNLLQPEPKGRGQRRLEGDSLQSFIACRTADPVLNFDPQPQQRSVMRGELLNTKWSLVQESERRREMHRSGGRERESCTQRTHLSSLGFFFPSFAFSFVFPAQKLLAFLPIHLSVLPVVIWFLWNGGAPPSGATITTAGMDSWQPGTAGFWEGKRGTRL